MKYNDNIVKLLDMTLVNEDFVVSSIDGSKEYEVRSAKRTVNGSLYKSNMTMFELELYGAHDMIGEELNIKRGISHETVNNGNVEWIDYGNFIVESNEYDTLEQVTTLKLGDYMLKTQVKYNKEDMGLTFPQTALNVFNRVLEVSELETTTREFIHSDVSIGYDLWADTSYTYRDVLDHIAELSSSIIAIKDNKVEVYQPQETGIAINLDKSRKIEMLPHYGKVNIVNITQEPQHSNTPYPRNWMDIPKDERVELAFANNPIFDTNQEKYGEMIFGNVNELEFKQATSETFGYGVLEIGDIVEVPNPETGEMFKTIVSFEETTFKGFPISEQRYLKPIQAEDEYVVETDEKRAGQETYILIDKANGNITLANERVDDLSESVSQIEINMDEILLLLEQRNSTNLWINSSGVMGVDTYTFDVEPIIMNDEDYPMIMGMTDYTMGRQDNLFKSIPFASLAENAFSIEREGTATSSTKYLVFDEDLYFHTKIKGNPHEGNYVGFSLLEYDKDKTRINVQDLGEHKPTRDMYHFKKKVTPRKETEYIAIEIRGRGTATNPVIITEGMLSYTDYAPYDISSNDVLEYTKSQIEILGDEINLVVESTDDINGKLNSSKVKLTAEKGLETWGNGITSYDQDGKEVLYLDTNSGKMTLKGHIEADSGTFNGIINARNSYVEGEINATSGDIGNMRLENGSLTITSDPYKRQYTQSDLSAIMDIIMSKRNPNAYEKHIYDVNNDGKVTSMDYAMILNYLKGERDLPLPTVQSQVELGNNQGEIISRVLYDSGKKGNETLIQADSIKTGTIDTRGLSIGGKSVEVDSNGFLKLV